MLFDGLALPLMCAPMSFASAVPLAVECCRAGVIGGWQGGNPPLGEFEGYLTALADLGGAPPIVNLPARILERPSGEERVSLLERHRAPLVLTSVGDPSPLVTRVHAWGGRVIHDVTTLRHAEKALDAGVDGLMLTCAGAGGHSGAFSPMAFVPAVRRFWDGLVIVAGGIADVSGIAAALALGGDLACMGTRFIATRESGVNERHRAMIAEVGMDRIVSSAAINGVPANWIVDSLEAVGVDPLATNATRMALPAGVRPWRDVFSAGHSVGLIDGIEPVSELVTRFARQFDWVAPRSGWRDRLAAVQAGWDRPSHPLRPGDRHWS